MNHPRGPRARKRFSQHFLRDTTVLTALAQAIAPQPSDHIVEIGPGHGELTELLLPLVQRLDAIEIDRDLVVYLQKKFFGVDHLMIHSQDVLTVNFGALQQEGALLRIVGNLPYHISTPILFKLFSIPKSIQDIHIMLQKEVAERLTAAVNTAHYGRLSVMAQYYCQLVDLFTVDPGAFYPAPQVDSAVIRMTPRVSSVLRAHDADQLSALVKEAFTYRRKTLRNSLKKWVSATELETLSISPEQRAQQLTVEDFIKISNMVSLRRMKGGDCDEIPAHSSSH